MQRSWSSHTADDSLFSVFEMSQKCNGKGEKSRPGKDIAATTPRMIETISHMKLGPFDLASST